MHQAQHSQLQLRYLATLEHQSGSALAGEQSHRR